MSEVLGSSSKRLTGEEAKAWRSLKEAEGLMNLGADTSDQGLYEQGRGIATLALEHSPVIFKQWVNGRQARPLVPEDIFTDPRTGLPVID